MAKCNPCSLLFQMRLDCRQGLWSELHAYKCYDNRGDHANIKGRRELERKYAKSSWPEQHACAESQRSIYQPICNSMHIHMQHHIDEYAELCMPICCRIICTNMHYAVAAVVRRHRPHFNSAHSPIYITITSFTTTITITIYITKRPIHHH